MLHQRRSDVPTLTKPDYKSAYRRLESVENQTEQLGRASADAREVDGLREDAFMERLTAIEKGIRDVSRNMQLVRDKQVYQSIRHTRFDSFLPYAWQSAIPL